MSFGITDTGFLTKDFTIIRQELEEVAVSLWTTDLDRRATNPLMIYLDIIAAREQALWNIISDVYANGFVISAQGTALDMLAVNRGLTRNDATKSQGDLTLNGDTGTIISIGNIFSTSGDNIVRFLATQTKGIGQTTETYATVSSATRQLNSQAVGSFGTNQITVTVGTTTYLEVASGPIGNQFSCDYATPNTTITFPDATVKNNVVITYFDTAVTSDTITIEAENTGEEYNVSANQINQVVTVINGIEIITNATALTGGTDIESDISLRQRLIEIAVASWTKEDLESEIENITGVRKSTVDEGIRIQTFIPADQAGSSPAYTVVFSDSVTTSFVSRVKWYDDDGDTTTDLIEGSDPLSAGEYRIDTSGGATDTLIYNITGGLVGLDTLTVTLVDADIDVGIFNVQIIPTSPPLSSTIRDTIESVVNIKKPFGVSFFVTEPTFTRINITPTVSLLEGFTVSGVQTDINDAISVYLDTLNIGDGMINAEIVEATMGIAGVFDVTDIKYEIDTEEIIRGATSTDSALYTVIDDVGGGMAPPATIIDEDSVTYTLTTDYVITAGEIDWTPAGSEPAQDKKYYVSYFTTPNVNIAANTTVIIIEGVILVV